MKSYMKLEMLREIEEQCQQLCVRTKGQPSILRTSKEDQKNLSSSFSWMKIVDEMKNRAPDVLDFLVTVAAPKLKEDGRQIPAICQAYGLLMNTRCRELSLVQKVNTIILGRGGATKMVVFVICIYLRHFQLCALIPSTALFDKRLEILECHILAKYFRPR